MHPFNRCMVDIVRASKLLPVVSVHLVGYDARMCIASVKKVLESWIMIFWLNFWFERFCEPAFGR